MKKYSDTEVSQKLENYDSWILDEESGSLVAGFEFEEFTQAMEFANGIAEIAEDVGHHPDLLIHDYNKVTIFTQTHDVNGITDKDFDLIDEIETDLEALEQTE
jgi:4a-hydroxytetrahydrobiopterin dehydratase